MFAPSRGGDFLKMGSRSIGGAVVIATAFKRNTGAGQSRLVAPFLTYSHFLNSPCVDHQVKSAIISSDYYR
jgi:hypothetical protein